MLPGIAGAMAGFAAQGGPATFKMIDGISALGLATNLKLCLDAGDADSYTSGQKWLDRSGGGYDFFRGVGSGSSTDDPTFNGVAGAQSSSEYWSFDGGDFFTYDTTTETWMDALHKNNATWTAVGIVYGMATRSGSLLSTGVAFILNQVGAQIYMTGGNASLYVANGSGSVYQNTSTQTLKGGWSFVGLSVDEAAGTLVWLIDRVAVTVSGMSFSSPSSSAATQPMVIGAGSAGSTQLSSGARLAATAVWQGTALTADQMLQLNGYCGTKFGF
jgi:hypothetical protein